MLRWRWLALVGGLLLSSSGCCWWADKMCPQSHYPPPAYYPPPAQPQCCVPCTPYAPAAQPSGYPSGNWTPAAPCGCR